jgi:hypothetical protein
MGYLLTPPELMIGYTLPKIKFKMVLSDEDTDASTVIQFKCKTCGELMELHKIDQHAKDKHNATSAMVDTTINRNN